MNTELKPCPFCGSPAKLICAGEYWVTCTKLGVCYASTPKRGDNGFTYKSDAISLWNTRSDTEAREAVVKEIMENPEIRMVRVDYVGKTWALNTNEEVISLITKEQ